MPILLWLGLLAGLLWRGRKAALTAVADPLVSFVFGSILIQALAAAAAFGMELGTHSLLRYMPHLLVFSLISAFVAIDRVPRLGHFAPALCAIAVACNFLTLSF